MLARLIQLSLAALAPAAAPTPALAPSEITKPADGPVAAEPLSTPPAPGSAVAAAPTEAEPETPATTPATTPPDSAPQTPAPAPLAAPTVVAPLAPASSPLGSATAPAATLEVPPPRFRGIGLFVAGGVLGAVGLPFKIIATSSDARVAREIDSGTYDPDVCVESCYVGFLFNIVSMPLLVTSAGLLGGGLSMHGRWAAHRDATRGLTGARRTRLMTGLGVGAIGAGLAAFLGTRLTLRNTTTDGQYIARRELGWWTLTAGLYAGAGLLGYSLGYEAGRRKLPRRVQAQVAPLLSPQLVGLGVTGRF
jgi:hypothetical protein